MPTSSDEGAPTSKSQKNSPEVPAGVSAFVAKVLDQLSLSSWLPGVFFAASCTALIQIRVLGDQLSFNAFFDSINANWRSILILGAPALILSVLIIQASAFASIQFLEGYGRARGIGRWIRSALIWWQVHQADSLFARRMRLQEKAFNKSKHKWDDEPRKVVAALKADACGEGRAELSCKHEKKLIELNWWDECDPWDMARIEEMVDREKEFPDRNRILPSRLGNVLRSTEDQLVNSREEVVNFVFRQRETVSPRIQLQHDQFRTRLDMYCTLVLVSGALSILSLAILWGLHLTWLSIIASGLFVAFALASYKAAISSARSYCRILKVMGEGRK